MKKYLFPILIVILLSSCSNPSSTPVSVFDSPTASFIPTEGIGNSPAVPVMEPTQPETADSGGLQLYKIHMVDENRGWGMGLTEGKAPMTLRTNDGGRSWKDTGVPLESGNDPGSILMACFFLNETTAWAVPFNVSFSPLTGQSIWKTTDGGESWQESTLLTDGLMEVFYISHMFFVDEQNGWLMAHVGAGMNHDYIAIYRTGDGGSTWERIMDPMSDDSGIQSCQKNGLVFSDVRTGWLTGSCNGVAPGVLFFRTEDGGASWEGIDLSPPSDQLGLFQSFDTACGSQFPDAGANEMRVEVACKKMNASLDQPITMLYTSSNGGNSWTMRDVPGGLLTYLPDDGLLVMGSLTTISWDNGETWKELPVISDGIQAQFITNKTGWILLSNGKVIYETIDGGESWQEISIQLIP